MVKEYTYSPMWTFYIDMIDREHSYDMGSFHTHQYELYYEVEGARRYFVDSAYIVNAGNVSPDWGKPDPQDWFGRGWPHQPHCVQFQPRVSAGDQRGFPEIDLFGFMSGEQPPAEQHHG